MNDDEDARKPIKPPAKDHPDDKVWAFVEAGVGMVPGGSGITRLVGEFIPTQAQKARGVWENTISARTNQNTGRLDQHDEVLAPKATLAGVAVQLATALAKEPGDGMRGRSRTPDDLYNLLPGIERKAVEEAAFELHSYGLVEIERAVGNHWWLYLTQKFYEQLDHQLMGWSTSDDAATLAELLLENEEMERTASLHASGWDHRRFNPAFQFLLGMITEGWTSKENQPNYPTAFIGPLPEDRARFRRFIESKKSRSPA